VEAAARTLGYRKSVPERPAPQAPARALALVLSDLTNPYYSQLCAGAELAARKAGWPLVVYQPEYGRWGEDSIAERVLALPVSGAVLVGTALEEGGAEAIRKRLCHIAQRLPIVTIGPKVEGLNCVNLSSDLSLSVRKSIAHLVTLGHRRVSFIGGSGGRRSSRARRKAYFEEMDRLGLPADRELATDAGFTPQAGEFCVNRLFSGQSADQRPTAIIAINDLVALGALRQLQRMGLRVPEDVALIGCDNQFFTPYLNPPLTTVDLHPFDHGVTAIEELIASVRGGAAAYSQVRECSLIVRESCGALLGAREFE
jgi:DNA-binding LacI/PurR family transcriptional regulator